VQGGKAARKANRFEENDERKEIRKNLLDNVDTSTATRIKETVQALIAFVGSKRVAVFLTPKYMARQEATLKLSGEKQAEAKKAIWENIRKVKAAMLSYLKYSEEIVKAAQEPAFKETKLRVEKSLDKDLPSLCKLVTGKILNESFVYAQ
jgi:cytochrome c556